MQAGPRWAETILGEMPKESTMNKDEKDDKQDKQDKQDEKGTPEGEAEGTKEQSFEELLATLPEPVRKAYEAHTAGLKSALDKERDAATKGTTAAKELADAKKKLAAYEKAQEEAERAKMSELDKLKADLAKQAKESEDAKAKADAMLAELQAAKLRAALLAEAAKQGFQDPTDAVALMDRSKIEMTEDGVVKGAEEALKALAKAKPYLLAKPRNEPGGTPKGRGLFHTKTPPEAKTPKVKVTF